MGLLQVQGTLDITQFWPKGTSDADTVNIQLDLAKSPFQYQAAPGAPFQVTHALDDAKVEDIKVVEKNMLTIRLQGIDAPELHYQPQKYRQRYAATAVTALLDRLTRKSATVLPCTVVTDNVATPNDVFDKYGRFIGDVIVKVNKTAVNINQWLVAQGHVLPSFYVSMSAAEIKTYLAAAKKGRAKGRAWKLLSQTMLPFDPTVLLRKNVPVDLATDKAPFILPKLFRRQCVWWNDRQAGKTSADFVPHLTKSKTKIAVLTDDFLATGKKAKKYTLGDFFDANGVFQRVADEIVFLEDPSKLLGSDNKPVTGW